MENTVFKLENIYFLRKKIVAVLFFTIILYICMFPSSKYKTST